MPTKILDLDDRTMAAPARRDKKLDQWVAEVNVRLTRLVAIVIGVAVLVFWPTDLWLFEDRPDIIKLLALGRPLLAVICGLTILLVSQVPAVRKRPVPVAGGLLAVGCFLTGYTIGQYADLSQPWYYTAYVLPFITIASLCGLWTRIAITLGTVVSFTLGYYLFHPFPLDQELVFGLACFHSFTVACAVGFGHLVYRQAVANYSQRQELAQLNAQAQRQTARMRSKLTNQMADLARSGKLSQFLPERVANAILAGELSDEPQFERQKITVVFSDLVGYTEMSSHQEPEEMAGLLNDYLGEMTAIVVAHGGVVDKFIGDAVMAIFGPPDLRAEAQIRAAFKCSLAMLNRVDELAVGWNRRGFTGEIKMRVGVHTGYATVGIFGSELLKSYTAVGTPVNLAARLQSAADPGQIVCSYSSWAPLQEELRSEPRGELELKGILEPIRAYRIRGLMDKAQAPTMPAMRVADQED